MYGDYLLKYNCIDDIFRKIMVRALEALTQKVDFLETSLIGRRDFIAVQYSVMSSGLPSNS
jgi:hypothetical protein